MHYLADRGDNRRVSGNDVRVIDTHPSREFDIRRTDNHETNASHQVNTGGLKSTISGEVIVIMNQHVCHGKRKPVHLSPQIEHYKSISHNRSIKVFSENNATTLDKCKVPISIRGALSYTILRTSTDKEL